MAYGMSIYDALGNLTLSISDTTPRLVTLGTVTVSGTTATQTVSSEVTSSDSIVATTNEEVSAQVTSTGTVTFYNNTGSSKTTNYRVLLV